MANASSDGSIPPNPNPIKFNGATADMNLELYITIHHTMEPEEFFHLLIPPIRRKRRRRRGGKVTLGLHMTFR